MADDIRFGDWVKCFNRIGIVMDSKKHSCLVKCMDGTVLQEKPENLKRFPRPGEMIYVKDIDDNDASYSRARFIAGCGDNSQDFTVECLSGKEMEEPTLCWKYWRLIPKEKSRKEKLDEILLAISDDDPRIMREVAEIILAAREKVSK